MTMGVLDHNHLVQQTVGGSRPGQSSGGWLVGYHGHENIQVIFDERKVSSIFISQGLWEDIEHMGSMNSQGPFPGLLHKGRGITWNWVRDSISPTPFTPMPVH